MHRGTQERGFVSAHLRGSGGSDEDSISEETRRAKVENSEINSFTYADLYASCFKDLGISDPTKIKKLTITEFKAFQKGAIEKRIDELENLHLLAYQSAMAAAHDKHGKPIYKNFDAMFDRKKYEDAMLSGFEKKGKVSDETIANFKRSKEHAENLLNGISVSTDSNYGEEDN